MCPRTLMPDVYHPHSIMRIGGHDLKTRKPLDAATATSSVQALAIVRDGRSELVDPRPPTPAFLLSNADGMLGT
jgi:hypothetical protein